MGRRPCCEKVGLRKGRWSEQEDALLSDYIHIHGPGSWRSLPKRAGLLRCGKSCRLRWVNYLKADIKRGNFSPEEDQIIINLHSSLGSRWSLIAAHLPGRTDNEIKNYWNSHLSRIYVPKMVVQGTSEAMPVAEIPDGHAGDTNGSCSSTECGPITIKEVDEMHMQCRSQSLTDHHDDRPTNPTAGNKEGRSTVPLQEPQPPQTQSSSATATTCDVIPDGFGFEFAPDLGKTGCDLLSPSPPGPTDYIGLEMDNTMWGGKGWPHSWDMQYTSDLGLEWAEMEEDQLWDEAKSIARDWEREGELSLQILSNWLLSDD